MCRRFLVRCSLSVIVDLSAELSDHHKILTSNWTSASKTSMLTLLKKGMFGGVRRPVSRIKRMNSLPLEGNM
jgi:hypothetical protein